MWVETHHIFVVVTLLVKVNCTMDMGNYTFTCDVYVLDRRTAHDFAKTSFSMWSSQRKFWLLRNLAGFLVAKNRHSPFCCQQIRFPSADSSCQQIRIFVSRFLSSADSFLSAGSVSRFLKLAELQFVSRFCQQILSADILVQHFWFLSEICLMLWLMAFCPSEGAFCLGNNNLFIYLASSDTLCHKLTLICLVLTFFWSYVFTVVWTQRLCWLSTL